MTTVTCGLGQTYEPTDRQMYGPINRQTLLPIELLIWQLETRKLCLLKLVLTECHYNNILLCKSITINSWLHTEIPCNIANCRATIAAIDLLLQLHINMHHYRLL